MTDHKIIPAEIPWREFDGTGYLDSESPESSLIATVMDRINRIQVLSNGGNKIVIGVPTTTKLKYGTKSLPPRPFMRKL